MKKAGKFLLRFVVIGFILFIVILLVLDRFIQFRMTDKEYTEYFSKKGLAPHLSYYKAGERQLRYASIGNDTAATLFFIHGAPSSLSYYRDYMSDSDLLHKASMYAADRAGYGFSGLGNPETSIKKQVELLEPILDSINKVHHPVIVVAASYGTAIACRFAMDHPELVDGLVLIAPALAPGQEKYFWFTYIIESPIFHWFIPRMLQSANAEKVHHKEELSAMLPFWGNIKVPVIYLQGDKDELVFTTNAAFAKSHLTHVPYLDIQMIPGRGHLIAFSEKAQIKEAILKMIDLAKLNIAGKITTGSGQASISVPAAH